MNWLKGCTTINSIFQTTCMHVRINWNTWCQRYQDGKFHLSPLVIVLLRIIHNYPVLKDGKTGIPSKDFAYSLIIDLAIGRFETRSFDSNEIQWTVEASQKSNSLTENIYLRSMIFYPDGRLV